mgnify:CR=1 FL=1
MISRVMLVKIIDKNNQEIGCIKREHLVRLGLRHQIGRVIVYTLDSRSVLLQQRSSSKSTMPGAWDTSSSGHIDAHEEGIAGAIRELGEELGVNVSQDDLRYVGAYDTYEEFVDGGVLDRQTVVYALVIDKQEDVAIHFDSVELAGIEWVQLREIERKETLTKGAKQALELFSTWLEDSEY